MCSSIHVYLVTIELHASVSKHLLAGLQTNKDILWNNKFKQQAAF